MSLDVYLNLKGASKVEGDYIFVRENGGITKLTRAEWDARYPDREPVEVYASDDEGEVYHANITHNLNAMEREAGLYQYLWRPEEVGITHARQLIEPLRTGLKLMEGDPERFRALNPPNGWGSYEGLMGFVEDYVLACERYPDAEVSISR